MQRELCWIQNERLRVGISPQGAEVCDIVDTASGQSMLWCGDPAVFTGHSPVLFPYTGRLTGDYHVAKGGQYRGSYHGFARMMRHEVVCHEENHLTLSLSESEETLAIWPYKFILESDFVLEGTTLHHVLTVKNNGEEQIQFGMGFHPAFAVPFDEEHVPEDYVIAFDELESPMCVDTSAGGLQSGKIYYLARNVKEIPVTQDMFHQGSHCMVNLRSRKVSLAEKGSGRRIEVDVEHFPYVLLWSSSKKPLRFLCIEPWQSLPGENLAEQKWEDKPAAAVLMPGEEYRCELKTTYVMK